MTRRQIWMLVLGGLAVVAVVVVTAVVAVWMRSASVKPSVPDLTRQQADARIQQYLSDTVNVIPGHATSTKALYTTLACDDPADKAPAGSSSINTGYRLSFDNPPDNTEVYTKLHEHWVSLGYHINIDQRSHPGSRFLVAENPHDGFAIGLQESNVGSLSVNISSPCMKSLSS